MFPYNGFYNRTMPSLTAFLEALSLIHYISLFFICNIIAIPVFICLFFSPFFMLPLIYLTWMYFDRETPYRGGRRFEFCRRLFVWKYLAHYFPVRLHKTADLDPTRNYMFCFHPHGVIGFGGFVNFVTEATDFSETFPGIYLHPLTINVNFFMPLFRDYILGLGFGNVTAQSINYKLTQLGPGHSVMIAVGGAEEALLADVDEPYKLKLLSRRGFIREALRAGSPIVPVFSFGESETVCPMKPQPNSHFEGFQKIVLRMFRFIPLFFEGKHFLIPHRLEINTVVGTPLELPHISAPTAEDLEYWHAKYIEALEKLFVANRNRYGRKDKNLVLV